MAVPKKRTGSSAQGHRRSKWKATKPETTICKKCGAVALTHTVCTECGTYKGNVVSIKDPNYVAVEKAERKAPVKKAVAKKPAAVKEVKEEAVVEVATEEVVEATTVETAEEKTEE